MTCKILNGDSQGYTQILWVQGGKAIAFDLELTELVSECELPECQLPKYQLFWEVDILGVDISRVDILGVDILRVDILGVAILGGTQLTWQHLLSEFHLNQTIVLTFH